MISDNSISKQPTLEKNIWTCISCKLELPLNSKNFHSDVSTSTKFKPKCKKCAKRDRLNYTRMIKKDDLDYFLKELLSAAKIRSIKKNIEFTISIEVLKQLWEKQLGKCAISGVDMTHTILSGRIQTNVSIDRIDSTKGYSVDNIQLVCVSVNVMKGTMNLSELKHFCKLIIENNEKERFS